MGASNIAAGLFGGFAISTSGSRTAVAEQSGAKSQLTGVVGAGVVLLLLLAFPSLLADLPQTALAAVVIAAALSLMDLRCAAPLRACPQERRGAVGHRDRRRGAVRRAPRHPRRRHPVDPVVLPPQLVATRRSARKGRRARRLARRRAASPTRARSHGVVVYPLGSPAVLRQLDHLHGADPHAGARARQPRWVVLQCEAITDVDLTAADMLRRLDDELNANGVHLAFVELRAD